MSAITLEVSPTQWAELKELHDVEPINDSDLECMAEIREVLKRHGKRERFGVALLHKHFSMQGDEVLLEKTDERARELSIKPVKRDAALNSVPTIWLLADDEIRAVQSCGGNKDPSDDPKPCAFRRR